jgi:hypothetical protein
MQTFACRCDRRPGDRRVVSILMNGKWMMLRLLIDDVVSFDKSAIWRQAFLWF